MKLYYVTIKDGYKIPHTALKRMYEIEAEHTLMDRYSKWPREGFDDLEVTYPPLRLALYELNILPVHDNYSYNKVAPIHPDVKKWLTEHGHI